MFICIRLACTVVGQLKDIHLPIFPYPGMVLRALHLYSVEVASRKESITIYNWLIVKSTCPLTDLSAEERRIRRGRCSI